VPTIPTINYTARCTVAISTTGVIQQVQ